MTRPRRTTASVPFRGSCQFCHASGKSPLRAECTKGAEVGINTCGHLFADDEEVTPKMRDWLRNQLKTFLDGI